MLNTYSRAVHGIAFDRGGHCYIACIYPKKDVIVSYRMNMGLLLKMRDVRPFEVEPEPLWVDAVFYEAKVRDAETHYSGWQDFIDEVEFYPVCTRGYSRVAIEVINGLDADVDVTVEGSFTPSFYYKFPVGTTFTVSAGSSTYETLTDPVPYIRIAVKAAAAPSSGELTVMVVKAR